jgi:hypothetical protein
MSNPGASLNNAGKSMLGNAGQNYLRSKLSEIRKNLCIEDISSAIAASGAVIFW